MTNPLSSLGNDFSSGSSRGVNSSSLNPQEIQEETKSDVLALLAKGSFALSGIGAGIVALVATAALAGLVGIAVGTPVGWAALGALGVGLTILAIRHAYISVQEKEPETLKVLGQATKFGASAAIITYLSVPLLYFGSYGLAAGGCCCEVSSEGERRQQGA